MLLQRHYMHSSCCMIFCVISTPPLSSDAVRQHPAAFPSRQRGPNRSHQSSPPAASSARLASNRVRLPFFRVIFPMCLIPFTLFLTPLLSLWNRSLPELVACSSEVGSLSDWSRTRTVHGHFGSLLLLFKASYDNL